MTRSTTTLLLALLATGCGKSSDVDADPGLAVLGAGSHDVSAKLVAIAGKSDGLSKPQDLAFNPEVNGELWVMNKKDDSATIIFDAGTDAQTSTHMIDPYALHFMEEVTSIAFGAPGTFGTCQDGTNTYNGAQTGNNFTGPTLWSSDLDVFASSNPEAVAGLGFDLGSHLDMLHESPECMGIAWVEDNIYWVFDGYHDSVSRYNFRSDHGVGWDDHSDGVIERFIKPKVKRETGTPSNLVYIAATETLYIADSGNNRILALDTTTGNRGDSLPTMEPGTEHFEMKGADYVVVVDGNAAPTNTDETEETDEEATPFVPMSVPSGLAIVDDILFITDNGNGNIYAYTLEGELLDWAATGLGAGNLGGLIAPTVDDLWMVDIKGHKVLRLQP